MLRLAVAKRLLLPTMASAAISRRHSLSFCQPMLRAAGGRRVKASRTWWVGGENKGRTGTPVSSTISAGVVAQPASRISISHTGIWPIPAESLVQFKASTNIPDRACCADGAREGRDYARNQRRGRAEGAFACLCPCGESVSSSLDTRAFVRLVLSLVPRRPRLAHPARPPPSRQHVHLHHHQRGEHRSPSPAVHTARRSLPPATRGQPTREQEGGRVGRLGRALDKVRTAHIIQADETRRT